MKRHIVLSGAARKRIREFDDAAQIWGWQSDQGTGEAVTRAEAEYNKAKRRLELFVARLERTK